jgi:hypothetical protein
MDKGTEGLKAFLKARNYTPELYVKLIRQYPKFWVSIRPNTLAVKSKAREIEQKLVRFKKLYPELKPAQIYFTIGGLRSGGTTSADKVLIGTEIASGTAATDVSEFPTKWLAGVFKEQREDNIVPLNIHEYVHTQQHGEAQNLLAQAINEGAADFIAELVINRPMQTNYISYGKLHEPELKELFKQDMFTAAYQRWLYNGGTKTEAVADLGYFMGYRICKSYYEHASSKSKAIKDIIELNYSDTTAVDDFLAKSEYYTEPYNKVTLLKAFQEKQPVVMRLEPFANGDTLVSPALKTMTIHFSRPMSPGFSINYGEGGKEKYPITKMGVFSDDKMAITIDLSLLPGHEYQYVLTDRSFASVDGYPLIEYPVKFKTRQ